MSRKTLFGVTALCLAALLYAAPLWAETSDEELAKKTLNPVADLHAGSDRSAELEDVRSVPAGSMPGRTPLETRHYYKEERNIKLLVCMSGPMK
jgi:hypothetical protein